MRRLLADLGDPQQSFPAIHVVGTNGKSTATRTIAALLRAEGLAVGAYTSPHVSGWHERLDTDPDGFERAVDRVRRLKPWARKKLRLGPEDHLVEIGTGWGGLAIHAAADRDCRVTTTTISREQRALAAEVGCAPSYMHTILKRAADAEAQANVVYAREVEPLAFPDYLGLDVYATGERNL